MSVYEITRATQNKWLNHWVVLRQYLLNAIADSDLVKPFMQLKLTLSAGNAFQILTTLELKKYLRRSVRVFGMQSL